MKLIAALLLLMQVAGIIRDGAAEILFPQAIRFTLNLEIPAADIQQARLMIMPAGRAPITFDVVPAEALVNANATAEVTAEISSAAAAEATMDVDTAPTQLTVMWRLSADDPPTLFSPIRYTWTVTTADGDATFEDTFVFADPNIDWARSIDPASGVSVSTVPALAGMVDSLRQVYDLLIDNVPDLPPGLVLYHFPFGCEVTDEGLQTRRIGENGMTVPCDPSIDEAVFAGYRPLVISSGLRTIDGVIDTVVRQLYADPWSNKSVPDWFQRGLAQFYTPVFKNALLVPVQQAARGRTLLSLDQMRVFDEAALWNAQSYAMVLYIVDQIGVEGLFALARVDAPNFESAYRSAVGHPVTALIPALEQWIFTRAADAAYGITPYQAPTAIPTATPLLTDTPTITPLPTATPTITPTTETPRLMRTYPPAPTVTPSETFTPLPPTITPRPPGSLTDPTPIPPPLQESLQAALTQPGVQIGVVTFLLLLLGLLVLLFIRVGNRR